MSIRRSRQSRTLREKARAPSSRHALAGIPISIKDLYDEAGVTTLAGSKLLVGAPAATRDSTVVERLKKAGAVIIGRTNMVEFAYSGLGLNPHYGTPKNAFDRAIGRIPGGSSSGAAISVTDGMAAGAIGSDTGGSVRIPAALNGLVGFKPTARRVPLDGVMPLSFTLDSAGPISKTVRDCALLDQVLAAEVEAVSAPAQLRGLRFAVPKTVFQNDLSSAVADAFTAALGRLSSAGATIVDLPMAEFAQAAGVNPRGALVSAEAGKDDETYTRFNLRMLRNPAIVNLFDGCALSVPCHVSGTAPVGMMIAGTQNTDRKILAIGLAVEQVVRKPRG